MMVQYDARAKAVAHVHNEAPNALVLGGVESSLLGDRLYLTLS